MSTLTKGYYHCLECGALFEATLSAPGDQQCSICGNPPTGKVQEIQNPKLKTAAESNPRETRELLPRPSSKLHGVNQDTQDIYEATAAHLGESRDTGVTRSKRKDQKGKVRAMLVGGWFVLMFGVVLTVKILNSDQDALFSVSAEKEAEINRLAAEKEEKRMLEVIEATPDCEKTMQSFLAATSAAAKAQYVYRGSKLSGVMSRYYRDEISLTSSADRVRIVEATLLDGFTPKVIGARCLNSRGEKWETIFIFDEGEWKIDWESLVRHDDRAWSLFPAAAEGAEGVFRLYMRVRDSNEDFEQKEMSLVFYKPTMRLKGEFRAVASVPVSVLIDSDLGREIMALLKQEDELSDEARKDAYGFNLGAVDPSRYHRVRVKMRLHREGEDGKHARMELLKILANHWYGIEPKRVKLDTED